MRTFAHRRLYAGIFVISAAALLLELALTRIFDVILWGNLAYLVVSGAIFGFSLAGVYLLLRPPRTAEPEGMLAAGSAAFAALVLGLIPALAWLPVDFEEIATRPARQALAFGALYLLLLAPFFAAGLVISLLLTRHPERVHRLYFWDLVGAGAGCLGIFLLPPLLGGEESLFVVAAGGALAAALFAPAGGRARRAGVWGAAALALLAVGLANRIDFKSMAEKRAVRLGTPGARPEFSRWDPVSKIDVLAQDVPWRKRVAYDGGSQSSAFREFDGDYVKLRAHYFDIVAGQPRYNSGKYVALAHWLRRDRGARTLVIGSAGGQETLAALAWGAGRIDAVEMVCTVINAARGPFADYVGRIFDDPRVSVTCDEGRNFLRRSGRRYDVIQIHSNHTTSSLANGSGGATPVYLQTVEAYKEYFSHLAPDGLLQINYFVYPRMIATAARAWAELFPGEDFRRHLVITSGYPVMPTFLVKRSEWGAGEVAEVRRFLGPEFPDVHASRLIYAPGEPEAASVPEEFFAVPPGEQFAAALPYRIWPPTDDRPFFRDLRKRAEPLREDGRGYVTADTVGFLNPSLKRGLPMESIHLYFLGGMAVVFAAAVIIVPLLLTRRRAGGGAAVWPTLIYFAGLGAGFIIIELALMSKLVLLVGFPVHAMATVLFTLLVSAGVGSYLSGRFPRSWGWRAILAVPAFAVVMMLLIAVFPRLLGLSAGMSQAGRIMLAVAVLVPVGIPLGMPFPLGIEALRERAPELIPWAWGINGFMTVVGSLLAIIISMKWGFNAALMAAVGIYLATLPGYFALTRQEQGERARVPRVAST